MKTHVPSQDYLEKAKLLTESEAERIQSRMSGNLARRFMKEKLSSLEALAIQLELEEEQLNEWREAFRKYSKKKLSN
jgi:hypothetical protein